MSAQTEADKKIDIAREHLRLALKSLSEVVVDQVSGYDEFTENYLSVLADAMRELTGIIYKIRN